MNLTQGDRWKQVSKFNILKESPEAKSILTLLGLFREYPYGLSVVFYRGVPYPCLQIAVHGVCPQHLDQKPDCLVLGHSFVQGLRHHFSNQYLHERNLGFESWTARQLQVDHNVNGVYLFGQRGFKITDPNTNDLAAVLDAIRPSIILSQYGSNDLAHGIHPQCVFSALVDMAIQLQANCDAVIGILSVVPRVANLSISPISLSSMHKSWRTS